MGSLGVVNEVFMRSKAFFSKFLIGGVVAAAAAGAVAQAGGYDAFASRFKPGQYQYTVEADTAGIPGMPKGFKLPPMTFNQCVTAKDIADGKQFTQGKQQGDMKCQISNFKLVGNAGSYTQNCQSPDMQMKADVMFTINGDTTVMQMVNELQPKDAPPMKTKANTTMKYMGNC
jgi:hypothetical protein